MVNKGPELIATAFCGTTHANDPENISDCAKAIRELLVELIKEAVLAEREACAKIADAVRNSLYPTVSGGNGHTAAGEIADSIRSRT